jgi:hypothetical protein
VRRKDKDIFYIKSVFSEKMQDQEEKRGLLFYSRIKQTKTRHAASLQKQYDFPVLYGGFFSLPQRYGYGGDSKSDQYRSRRLRYGSVNSSDGDFVDGTFGPEFGVSLLAGQLLRGQFGALLYRLPGFVRRQDGSRLRRQGCGQRPSRRQQCNCYSNSMFHLYLIYE